MTSSRVSQPVPTTTSSSRSRSRRCWLASRSSQLAAQHVEVSAVAQDSRVHVSVRDDGPGVPVHDAESVFAPGHTTGTGSGLGLALARRIARSTGGDVTLVEDDDHVSGATFVVSLPLG